MTTASTGPATDGRDVPGIVVRAAEHHELEAAGAAVAAAYAADGHGHGGYLDVIADARTRARTATVAVALDGAGQVIGSVTFALPGSEWAEVARDGEAEFRMLGVLPSHRGLGVGAALVEWCIDAARRLGRERLVMCSQAGMTSAHRIYTRRGFTRRPDLDWAPLPGILLLGFGLDLAGR